MELFLQQFSQPLAICDIDLKIIWANDRFLEIAGDITGDNLSTIIAEPYQKRLFDAADGLRHISLGTISSQQVYSLVHGDNEKVLPVVYELKRIGEHIAVVIQSPINPDSLIKLLESTRDIIYIADIDAGRILYTSDNLGEIIRTTSDHFIEECIHQDDIATLESKNKNLGSLKEGDVIEAQYRLRIKDGDYHWFRCYESVFSQSADDGNPLHVIGILHDITDQRTAENQRLQMLSEEQRVNLVSDFITNSSHEFRTILSIINTKLYLIRSSPDVSSWNDHLNRHLDILEEQAKAILKLVDSLTTMSRLDHARSRSRAPVNIKRLLNSVIDELSADIRAMQIDVRIDCPETLMIEADHGDILGTIYSLVDNAVRYNHIGGSIKIDVKLDLPQNAVAIQIADTGIGIHSKDTDRIFERFYRVDASRTTRGFGLGLSIARKVAEQHHGHLTVESTPGKGSVFTLQLPIVAPPAVLM